MKTDFSKLPREEIEARITTMLMGEMSPEEARELMEFVSGDTELRRLHDELKATISLVTESSAVEEGAEKLSEGRREALLQAFKTVKAPELAEKGAGRSEWRNWAAMAAMVGILLGGAVLVFSPTVTRSSRQFASSANGQTDELEVRLTELPRSEDGRVSISGQVAQIKEGADRGRSQAESDAAFAKKMGEMAQARGAQNAKAGLPKVAEIAEPKNRDFFTREMRARKPVSVDQNGIVASPPVGQANLARGETTTKSDGARLEAKIELPQLNESEAASQPQAQHWEFEAGRNDLSNFGLNTETRAFGGSGGRGLGGFGGGLGQVPSGPPPVSAGSVQNEPAQIAQLSGDFGDAARPEVAGKNLGLAYGESLQKGALIQRFGETPVEKKDFDAINPTALAFESNLPPAPAARPPGAVNRFVSRQETILGEDIAGGIVGAKHASDSRAKDSEKPVQLSFEYAQKPAAGIVVAKDPDSASISGDTLGVISGNLIASDNAAANEAVRAAPNIIQERRAAESGKEMQEEEEIDRRPAEKVLSRSEEPGKEASQVSKKIRDARMFLGKGQLQEAEQLLKQAVKADPEHRAAHYYLDLVQEQKKNQIANTKPLTGGKDLARNEPLGREALPEPMTERPAALAPIPQPEVLTAENAFSTFSLNVSDVSFKLAAASLEKGVMPEAASVRSEEFINAFDYRDPEPQGAPVGFVWERARYPFAQGRDLVRFSVKTAARGREAGRPLNLVLLLDSSGSMERADRVRILQECLKTLAGQLHPEDTVSVVAFARTARLWVDGLPGSQAGELAQRVGGLTPEGGTNLEEAMKVAYETARKHFNAGGVNRVVLLTDGAANLGDVEPESLKRKVEEERKRGVALDCFGIGWEGLNDELLETLSRNGDGRYGFVNTPEAAGTEFAGQLAGALQVAASDVKVQVEWNPKRVTAFRQIGYAKHQLTKEQFRDNTVDAAELGAAEAGNALYAVQVNSAGEGPLGTLRVRFKAPGTNDYREHAWTVDYDGAAKALENSSYALRLAGTASAFSEWLAASPFAAEVTSDRLLGIFAGVPEHFAPDPRPTKLEWMIRQAKSVAGK